MSIHLKGYFHTTYWNKVTKMVINTAAKNGDEKNIAKYCCTIIILTHLFCSTVGRKHVTFK